MVNPLIQWWHGKSLPKLYIYPPEENRPKDFLKLIRLYFRTWVVHPIKRRIAKYYLWLLQSFFGLNVIAITGSSGKTSTKDLLYSILSLQGETVASHLNIDSTFNIPTTILKCSFSTKYLILEMGVEYKGDMDFYRWLVTPNVSVVTNVYQTHTLHLDSVEGVAKEKGKIVENLPKSSFAILNKENTHTVDMAKRTQAQVVWFGKDTDFEILNPKLTLEGTEFLLRTRNSEIKAKIPLVGEHFASNALAAATVASVMFTPIEVIKNGLETAQPTSQRLNVKKLKNGAVVLDDTYNNNPSAAKATFAAVAKIKGNRKLILVYGDMKELGETEVQRHKEIGKVIENLGADFVILVGPLSVHTQSSLKKTKNVRVDTTQEVLPLLKTHLTKNALVLVKGARSLKLEELVSKLT